MSSVHIFHVSGLLTDRSPRVRPEESQFTVTSTKVMHSGTNWSLENTTGPVNVKFLDKIKRT